MALFIGGPADGWRIDVNSNLEVIRIPVNPHPPAFTPDITVLAAVTVPMYDYKREQINCDTEKYYIYVPVDWTCTDIIEALLLGYKPELNTERLKYIRTAEGRLYATDDRIRDEEPY